MELEVGMFVRFKTLSNEVKIGQIQLIDNNIYDLDNNEVTADKYIIKSSHTLLGDSEEPCLIEVGDYVNGYKVLRIEKDYLFDYREEINILIVQNDEVYEVAKKIYSDGIKSIVTKEQFEAMKYEVGE